MRDITIRVVALVVGFTLVGCALVLSGDDHDYTLWASDCREACGERGVFVMTTTTCECRVSP